MRSPQWVQMNSLGAYTDNFIEYLTERPRGGFGLITQAPRRLRPVQTGRHPYDDVYSLLRLPKTFHTTAIKVIDIVHKYGCKIFLMTRLSTAE